MTPAFAALLLVVAAAEGHIGEEPAPVAAPPPREATATTPVSATDTPAVKDEVPAQDASKQPATTAPANLPEATAGPARPAAPQQPLKILAQDPRMDAYAQFRQLYETAQYAEALPYARQVVEMSEQDPDRDHELPIAYNNLGATQYQLGDFAGAGVSYGKSLELLESTQGIASRRLVVPLAGLGAVSAAQEDHKTASEYYDRAVAVSRRADGLFNLQQVPLLKQAADSRYALSDFPGAESEYMYALRIAEQNYGYGDAQTLPALLDLATFYEGLREFIAARMMYLRARDVSLKASPGYSPVAIRSLLGIARTHRLQYTMDPNSLEAQPSRDEVTGEPVGKVYTEARSPPVSGAGLKSAQAALDMLRSTGNPPADEMTATLVELGDGFQSISRPALAMPYYAEAFGVFDAQATNDPAAANPLKSPRMVFYRPPFAARRLNKPSSQYAILKTVFSFTVDETGIPQEITVVSNEMSDDQMGQSRRALQKAIYSPRFSEGKAVSTAGVTFTSEWYDEQEAVETPPAAPATPTTQPAEAAATPPPNSGT